MPMMAITTSNSIKVKPRGERLPVLGAASKPQSREGERPGEPNRVRESREIRAREDARLPEKPILEQDIRL